MGSILQNLGRRQDGLLLFESFESPNFTLDQLWILLNGTPALSNSVSKDGFYSLALDSTCALLENDIIDSSSNTNTFGYAVAWFYDDASNVASNSIPSFVAGNSGVPLAIGIGVNKAISTTLYSVVINGSWFVTATPRTTGWHRFSIVADPTTSFPYAFIDNVSTGFTTGAATLLTQVQLGCQANTGDGFGFFDLVQVCYSSLFTLMNLTDPQGVTIISQGSAPQVLSSSGQVQINLSHIDCPFDGYLVVSNIIQDAGVIYPSAPVFQSDILSLSAGDIYFLNQFRFGRRPSSVSVVPTQVRNDTKAIDGPKQSMFFNDTDMVQLTFNDLTEDLKNALLSWWTTAKRGEIFSAAVEEDDIYLDFTQGHVSAFPNGQLLLAFPPPGTGKVLTVQSPDGTIKENVTVAGSSFDVPSGLWTATLQAPQVEAVDAGLQVKALYYWPFCSANATQLSISISNVKVKRWNVQISFMEQVQAKDFMSFFMGLDV